MSAPNVQRADALAAGSQLQSYIILKVIGSGAFGITYLAEHIHLGSQHVIKEYFPDSGVRLQGVSVSAKSSSDQEIFDWGLGSFFQEAKLLYGLSHPNIVKVTDLFEANGTAYFVMPYLRGITLHQWIKEHPQPSEDELAQVFIPLLEGLKYIHAQQLLHRDIKPENIFITENHTPVLIDFGAARQAIGQKSRPLTQILTPPFAPIEQYQSRDIFLPALDLYSLGACIYQAVTGRLIEEAPSRIVGEDTQPKLAGSSYARRYSPEFLAAVDYALNVRAENRFQNAMDMQQALLGQAALPAAPATAVPAGAGQTQAVGTTAGRSQGGSMAHNLKTAQAKKAAAPVPASGSSKGLLWAALAGVLLLAIGAGIYFYIQRSSTAPSPPLEVVAQTPVADPPVQLPSETQTSGGTQQPTQPSGGGTRMEITPEAVAAMNQNLPQMMGESARLDRIYYAEGSRTLVYQITLVSISAGEYPVSDIQRFGDILRDGICNEAALREWIVDNGGTVLTAFSDKNGQHLLDSAVSRQHCEG